MESIIGKSVIGSPKLFIILAFNVRFGEWDALPMERCKSVDCSCDLRSIAFEGIIKNYKRLIDEFGIKSFKEVLPRLSEPHMNMRRGIVFGHIDFERILDAVKKSIEFAVMTGIKPLPYHIGSFITCEEVIHFQKMGGHVFFCIADLEAYAINRIPLRESYKISIDNLADLLALGLEHKRTYIYRQSESINVLKLANIFSSHVTKRTLEAIYGERPFGHYMSALIQAADILQPQLKEFGGPKPTITPVGADQAPHSRLTRDLARKEVFRREYGFILPSFTFHTLIRGLDGSDKMSKRNPRSYFAIDEGEDSIVYKVKNAFTGGRETAKLQRKLGGQPEICPIYELEVYFFTRDDEKLRRIYFDCKNGDILCGEHKDEILRRILVFRKDHLKRKRKKLNVAQRIIRGNHLYG